MKKSYILTFLTLCATGLLNPDSVLAQWPTFDPGTFGQSLETGMTKVETGANTAQNTLSVTTIQQAVGDALGPVTKFKDQAEARLKKEAEKAERIQKAKQRAEKMKQKYERAKEIYDRSQSMAEAAKQQATKMYNQAKDMYEEGTDYVDEAKGYLNSDDDTSEYYNQNNSYTSGYPYQGGGQSNSASNKANTTSSPQSNAANSQSSSQTNAAKAQSSNATNNLWDDDDFDMDEDVFEYDEEFDIDEDSLDNTTFDELGAGARSKLDSDSAQSDENVARRPFGNSASAGNSANAEQGEEETATRSGTSGGLVGNEENTKGESKGNTSGSFVGTEEDRKTPTQAGTSGSFVGSGTDNETSDSNGAGLTIGGSSNSGASGSTSGSNGAVFSGAQGATGGSGSRSASGGVSSAAGITGNGSYTPNTASTSRDVSTLSAGNSSGAATTPIAQVLSQTPISGGSETSPISTNATTPVLSSEGSARQAFRKASDSPTSATETAALSQAMQNVNVTAIWLYKAEAEKFVLVAQIGKELEAEKEMVADDELIKQVLEQQQTAVETKGQNNAPYSRMIVPLKGAEKPLGILVFVDENEREFTEQDIKNAEESAEAISLMLKDTFVVSYLEFSNMSFAQEAPSMGGMKTGTTDEGRFIFPDKIAEKCELNYDEATDEKIAECIRIWVLDMHNENASDATEAKNQYSYALGQQMGNTIGTSWTHKAYAATFDTAVADDLESKSSTTTTERDILTMVGEVNRANQEVLIRLLDSYASKVMTEALESVPNLDDSFFREEGEE